MTERMYLVDRDIYNCHYNWILYVQQATDRSIMIIRDKENINKIYIELLEGPTEKSWKNKGKRFSKFNNNSILTNPRSSTKPKQNKHEENDSKLHHYQIS